RLNGHARAFGCGKSAIYTVKTMAAIVSALEGELTFRPVAVTVDCSTCGGSGQFWHYHPEDKSPCRRCSARGKVKLDFVESRIGARTWHHPWIEGGGHILRAAGFAIDYDADGTVLVSPGG